MVQRRRAVALVTVSIAALATTACGPGAVQSNLAAEPPVTITFWHGWSQPHEVKAIEDNLARFHHAYPNITVKEVKSISDDDMTKAIGSGKAEPDVVTSFSTNMVGQFCDSGDWIDLEPLMRQAKISPKRMFPRAVMDYTQYGGKRCALPLLADSFGLYYNKDMFAAAGIANPPRTLSELRADAIKLTRRNGDGSIAVAGFPPLTDLYEMSAYRLIANWQPQYFDSQGHSNLARDPAIQGFLNWQKDLVNAEGGYSALSAFQSSLGDEFSPQNAFEAGRIAMMFDGEWRNANLTQDKVPFTYGTAPFPVPDNLPDTYGAGYLAGTVIGISKNSQQQPAAWQLVKFMTTQTDALTSFAQAITNVPSTFQSLDAVPQLSSNPNFKTFLDIFASPDSGTTPTSRDGSSARGGFDDLVHRWEAGDVRNPAAELAALDQRIDAAA
ncbi:MAG: hypothetical protein AUG44_24140 [Actinobacteria bacterium 13_1_20CM_3_71_11]|nr:MAG: hypothetical protein AUG44_24140 [Actinobacteria bacterium 13_1_20CM_3_71_11]